MDVPPLSEGNLLFVIGCYILVGLIVGTVCLLVYGGDLP